MFTGLITDVGHLERLTPGGMTSLWIASSFADFQQGESIACDGCCLTVVEWKGKSFKVEASPETLRRTTLGRWVAGTQINLERALRAGDRLGGHLVQGHVDAVSEVKVTRPDGGSWVMAFSLPETLALFFVEKGSVCIDGISLTVNRVDRDSFEVALIPETVKHTSLSKKGVGSQVNLEADIIGKYVARMVGLRAGVGLSKETLAAAGFD
jgi:riboflavin synthase